MTTTTRPPSFQPRVLEHDVSSSRPGIRLPKQWLRGLLAGFEAVVLGWLVLVVPAVAVYVATASDPALGAAGWTEAVSIGTSGWFLAHGAVLSLGDATLSIAPLGLTVLFAFLMSASIRRANLVTWIPVVTSVVAYVGFGALLLFTGPSPGASIGLIGAAAVGAIGALWGMRRRFPPVSQRLAPLAEYLHGWVHTGVRAANRTLIVLGLASVIAVGLGVGFGFSQILDVQRGLHADPVSTGVIILAQVLLIPVMMVWALAFLLGPGFSVGAGTIFAPGAIDSGPMPLIPILGGLPQPDSLVVDLPAFSPLGIIVGLAMGWWLVRRQREEPLWHSLASGLVAVTMVGLIITGLAWLASGSIGAGAMSVVGPDPLAVGITTGWQLTSGTVVAVVLLHPALRAQLARLAERIWPERSDA